jgi:hypothetical protein
VRQFNDEELQLVDGAAIEAARLVTDYYRLAPREWARMRYEVKTQREIAPPELLDNVLAHVVCYEYTRQLGRDILEHRDIYRICLQDNRILDTLSARPELLLPELLVYILTHELVHVVRFGQQLQRLDLPAAERWQEELSVEKITHRILGLNENERKIFAVDLSTDEFGIASHA